ncbi:tetr bacterial regulatory protein hth signature [Lucifera butyrica]|uniref:Tetr bacterial regulatory protein hth signature n=1 Tax=Lucifera butyrica TaxID=1351585 RepID=A0A498R812_9FIRM|nr:TetR/AcrR family transcriptional regulator [Lucifera butyrica]VBB07060.1 tetr bacterial regulatory protein hth signature [Lucifera butyrica]
MKTKQMTSRKLQAAATRNKIYNTAMKLIRKKGFANISVSDICQAAGVSVGTYYHYFQSKNDILFEIYNKGDNYFDQQIKTNLKSADSLGKIREYLNAYIEFVTTNGFDMVKHLYTSENKLFVAQGRAMQTILRDLIQEGQAKQELSAEMPPGEAVDFIFVILRGIVFDWCLKEGRYDLKSYSERFIQCICSYLAKKAL